MRLRGFATSLVVLILLGSPNLLVGQGIEVRDNSPPAVLLAFIDTNQDPVPRSLEAVYDDLLDSTDSNCPEGRQKISDMAVKTTQFLEEDYGKDVSARRVLEELKAASEGGSPRPCSELLSALTVMIGGG